jgi:DNA-binding transcriptional MerR regulator
MRIGELARRTGVNERLLRYYEQQELLNPCRTPTGYRIYREADVEAVRRIRTLLAAGLSTAVISQVLPCVSADGQQLAPTCPDLVAKLQRERARMTAAIDDLATSRGMLDTVIAAAPAHVTAVSDDSD